MAGLSYSEILRENALLGKSMEGTPAYTIAVLSNIVVAQLNAIFEHPLRRAGIHARVSSGDYDNIPQDSLKFREADLVIVFWEACNIRPLLQARANVMEAVEIQDLVSAVKAEIDFVLNNLSRTSLVFFNQFSSMAFNHHVIGRNNFDRICEELNAHLTAKEDACSNLFLVDVEKILASMSVSKAVDFRFFYSSKSLYSIEFFRAYADYCGAIIQSVAGKARKALIFDCDNTLWKGVLGEDGFDGIEMSARSKAGAIFEEIQQIAVELSRKGVLIGLCSKNNLDDVNHVIENHPDACLRDASIAIKRINWEDKASNLAAIARDLNIGLNSLVFIDDSDFEIERVRSGMPEVLAVRVPESLHDYPELLRKTSRLFYSGVLSKEDAERGAMYQREIERKAGISAFQNVEEYLASLQLGVSIAIDEIRDAPRLAQLTQKTNQFNLTTKRYTEADIRNFIDSRSDSVVSFSVADKFGGYGLVGLCIVCRGVDAGSATIDTLLMSCRTIGRNIELAFFDFLIPFMKDAGIEAVEATYIQTQKNNQVIDFYERVGFQTMESTQTVRNYRLELDVYQPRNLHYISIRYGNQN
ncbi:MAG: HAD-IIIC family phosphatase [Terrimicrobiaceae bacterium]|nr:HAD-IIIC family phosphatase [Terrimicrobiaceae bacterium]